jgi:hypothetical protein
MRFPRMTTRRWMIVVAVVGLVLGMAIAGLRLHRRRELFLVLTKYHESKARLHKHIRGWGDRDYHSMMIDYSTAISHKYFYILSCFHAA